MIYLVALGIPSTYRARVWLNLAGAAFDRPSERYYVRLLQKHEVRVGDKKDQSSNYRFS